MRRPSGSSEPLDDERGVAMSGANGLGTHRSHHGHHRTPGAELSICRFSTIATIPAELENFFVLFHAVGFSVDYLANVPEVVDLAKAARQARKDCFVFVGGHSVSFIAQDVLAHGEGAMGRDARRR